MFEKILDVQEKLLFKFYYFRKFGIIEILIEKKTFFYNFFQYTFIHWNHVFIYKIAYQNLLIREIHSSHTKS